MLSVLYVTVGISLQINKVIKCIKFYCTVYVTVGISLQISKVIKCYKFYM